MERKTQVIQIHAVPGSWAATNERKMIVREGCIGEIDCQPNRQGVACICVMVTEDGDIRSRAVNVEPEHVLPINAVLTRIKTKLRTFASRAKSKHPLAEVINIK